MTLVKLLSGRKLIITNLLGDAVMTSKSAPSASQSF